MEHSSIADMAGWRSLAVQLGLVAVGALSVAILFSFGGQLIVAPGLLPVQWMIARHSDGWVATLFAVLGALLSAEVLVIATPLLLEDGVAAASIGIATGLAAALAFLMTSRGRR